MKILKYNEKWEDYGVEKTSNNIDWYYEIRQKGGEGADDYDFYVIDPNDPDGLSYFDNIPENLPEYDNKNLNVVKQYVDFLNSPEDEDDDVEITPDNEYYIVKITVEKI